MNPRPRIPGSLARAACAAIALIAVGLAPTQAQSLSPDTIDRIMKSSALIYILDANDQVQGNGSGTLISASGYVLTNFHVVGDLKTRKYYAGLAVGFVEFQDAEPEAKYRADVVVADPNLDLAIIKLTRDIKKKPLPANTYFGEPVQIGDSGRLRIGEPVYLFGFPGVGGYTITFSTGIVGGFVAQDGQSSGRDWIKHSANSGPGNSGGGLFNAQGQLVGVHTRGVADSDSAARQPLARPVALGLGLMVSNVPDLKIGAVQDRVTPPSPTPPSPTPPSPTPPSPTPGQTQTVQLSWPPQRVINRGQAWTVSISGAQTFKGVITDKDSDGDWTGTGGSNQVLYTFAQDNGGFIFQVFDSASGSSYFCLLPDQKSIKGGVFAGEAYFKKDKNTDTQAINKTCTVTLAAQGTNMQPPAPTGNTWPPPIAVGQTWAVSIPGTGTWRVSLTNTDKDGDPTGLATSTSGSKNLTSFLYYDKKDDRVYLDMTDGTALTYCAFEQKNVTNTQMIGAAYYRANKDAKTETLKSNCTITLGAATTVNTAPTGNTVQLAWPPQSVINTGQTWAFSLQGAPKFNGSISGKDSDGDWTGAGAGGQTLFTFTLENGSFVFQVLERSGGASWFCVIPSQSIQAGSYVGQALYQQNKDAQTQNLNQSCSITLAR